MKPLLLLPLIFLTGCGPDSTAPGGDRNIKIGVTTHTVRTVVLDGNEYYVTTVHGGITLCPKTPAKAEKGGHQ